MEKPTLFHLNGEICSWADVSARKEYDPNRPSPFKSAIFSKEPYMLAKRKPFIFQQQTWTGFIRLLKVERLNSCLRALRKTPISFKDA